MAPLHLSCSPTDPHQLGHLRACHPAVSCLPFFGKRDANDITVKPLLLVMVDRGAQILKVSSRAAGARPIRRIVSTGLAVHVSQFLGAPPVIKARDPSIKSPLVGLLLPAI